MICSMGLKSCVGEHGWKIHRENGWGDGGIVAEVSVQPWPVNYLDTGVGRYGRIATI